MQFAIRELSMFLLMAIISSPDKKKTTENFCMLYTKSLLSCRSITSGAPFAFAANNSLLHKAV